MPSSLIGLVFPILLGIALSAFFLAALRFTIERALLPKPRPWLFMLGFFARLATVMVIMISFCGSSPRTWLLCLTGFVCGRVFLQNRLAPEAAHAHRA